MPSWVINIIVTAVIPFLVQFLKKWLGGNQFAPIIAIALAGLYVVIGKMAGIETDINTVYQAILLALGIGGAAVLSYDVVKTTILNK
jgi:hypothetical protein